MGLELTTWETGWEAEEGVHRLFCSFNSYSAPQADGTMGRAAPTLTALPDGSGYTCDEFTICGLSDGSFQMELSEGAQNVSDYYILEWAQDGEIDFTLSAIQPEGRFTCAVYDAQYRQIGREYANPAFSLELAQGRYYVVIEAEGQLCGDYLFSAVAAA